MLVLSYLSGCPEPFEPTQRRQRPHHHPFMRSLAGCREVAGPDGSSIEGEPIYIAKQTSAEYYVRVGADILAENPGRYNTTIKALVSVLHYSGAWQLRHDKASRLPSCCILSWTFCGKMLQRMRHLSRAAHGMGLEALTVPSKCLHHHPVRMQALLPFSKCWCLSCHGNFLMHNPYSRQQYSAIAPPSNTAGNPYPYRSSTPPTPPLQPGIVYTLSLELVPANIQLAAEDQEALASIWQACCMPTDDGTQTSCNKRSPSIQG